MSSELQLDVRCLSCCGGDIWWTLTKERQAWCYLQVKLCDPCLSVLSIPPWRKKRYINTLPFLSYTLQWFTHLTFRIAHLHGVSGPYLILASLGSPKSTSQWHLGQFSHFCRAHDCDRSTDHATPSVTTEGIYVQSTARLWYSHICAEKGC